MTKPLISLIFFIIFFNSECLAQAVGISIDSFQVHSSALLDVQSNVKGILIPRMTSNERNLINTPASGLLVFDTDQGSFNYYQDGVWQEIKADNNAIFEKNNDVVSPSSGFGQDDFVFGRASLPLAGTTNDTLFFFDHEKAAFRGGQITNSRWQPFDIGQNSFAFGHSNKASGMNSTALGNFTVAEGNGSFAIGKGAESDGEQSIAMGHLVESTGDQSFVVGLESYAYGDQSIALGLEAVASGNQSVALGEVNTASGENSLALGRSSTSSGPSSVSIGIGTQAQGSQSTALGQYNNPIVATGTNVGPTTPVLIVGNGDNNSNRSNALVILKNGKVGIGTNTPSESLDLNGAIVIKNHSAANPVAGTIRYTGTDYQGFDGSNWVSLTMDSDNDSTNEKITNLDLTNSVLKITEGGISRSIDLSNVAGDDLGNHIATASIDMQGKNIYNLSAPNAANDATTRAYVDAHTDGDASTTNEVISTTVLNGNVLEITESGITHSTDLSTLDGDDLGNHRANQSLDMFGWKITQLAPPTGQLEAANKGYVDNNDDDNQTLTFIQNSNILSISGGNSVVLDPVNSGNIPGGIIRSDGTLAYELNHTPEDVPYLSIATNPNTLGIKSNILFGGGMGIVYDDSVFPNLGVKNTVIGYLAGENLGSGNLNTLIGHYAGRYANTDELVAVGNESGFNSTGTKNTYIGSESGKFSTTGSQNTMLGYWAGRNFTTESGNTCIGDEAGSLASGAGNTFIGDNAGWMHSGDGNIFLGVPGTNSNGNDNIYIGTTGGAITESDMIRIGTATPGLIVGRNAQWMELNGHFYPSAIFDIGRSSDRWNNIYLNNPPDVASDRRLKTNIKNLDYGLEEILKIRPVSYQLKNDKYPTTKLGLIAQEAFEIIPEVVTTHSWKKDDQTEVEIYSENDFYSVTYSELIPVLINAIQEQEKNIQEQENTIMELQKLVLLQGSQIDALLSDDGKPSTLKFTEK